MKRFTIICVLLCLIMSSCTNIKSVPERANEGKYHIYIYSMSDADERDGEKLSIEYYTIDTYSSDNLEPAPEIEYEFEGEKYTAKYLSSTYLEGYTSRIDKYRINNKGGYINIKTCDGSLVLFRKRVTCSEERPNQESINNKASTMAEKYIKPDMYSLDVLEFGTELDVERFIYTYTRYISDIKTCGYLKLGFLVDGQLSILKNVMTKEWENAIQIMGEEYYLELGQELSSEEVRHMIEDELYKNGALSCEIVDHDLILLNETEAGMRYIVNVVFENYEEQIWILVTK